MNELKLFLQNKRNRTSFIIFFLLLLVVPLGIALSRLPAVFFSRASGTYIQLGEGSCVTTGPDGEKALKCGTVPLVLFNPFAVHSPSPSPSTGGGSVPPTDGPVCTTTALSKTNVVNANNSITYTYTYPAGTKINQLNLPAKAGLQFSANGQTASSGQPLSVNYGAAAASSINFTIKTDTACIPFTEPFTMVNSCGTTMNDFVGPGSIAAWGAVCAASPSPTAAPVACQPPPNIQRPTMTQIPGGLRVTRIAGTNSNTPTNILTGFNMTGFNNVRIDYNGRTYKAATARNIDLRSGAGSCGSSCTGQTAQGAQSITFDMYVINNNNGGTFSFTMIDGCRGITDFAGSASRSTFGAGTPPSELPGP